jgi:uncharacterized membrane protein
MSKRTLKGIAEEKYFRWRGKEVSRTENLSDIVFAMALTLIVASSVPASFAELTGLWREAIAIGLCFAMLLMIWRVHYVFFRRYDLEDGRVMFLNSVLMFLIMVFAYPLKFLASFLVNLFTHGFTTNEEIGAVLTLQQAPWLTIIFSCGYASLFVVFALMYAHARKQAEPLGLNPAEVLQTTQMVKINFLRVGVAAIVIVLAYILPGTWKTMAGWFFMVGGIGLGILRRRDLQVAKAIFEAEKAA